MHLKPFARMLLLGTVLAWPIGAIAQEPWIDAGQQAMIMHNGALLEQQTAPNNGAEADGSASPPQNSTTASQACSMDRDREKLRPEYERRVRIEGEQAAISWLRREAAALGRQAAARAKAGERC